MTAAKLGIRRLSVTRERRDVRGDVIHGIGDNSEIPLSGGDGADFSRWWTVTCTPTLESFQCRSPDGCQAHRLEGRSYCPKHHAIYTLPMPPPSGRMPGIAINIKRRRKRQPPRLDLLERTDVR